ncbi:hypothetical protein AX27061_5832 [Achromobacter xylosoxidans NBRC 15126 = ATCC 27061]|nr:hypothetical protein AX27061_5832 [Achromobacter xylosoxidans NBRC 15126 = ATCC 27061]
MASAAQVAARIELENNSRYMNRDKVGRLKAELTDDLLWHQRELLPGGL